MKLIYWEGKGNFKVSELYAIRRECKFHPARKKDTIILKH